MNASTTTELPHNIHLPGTAKCPVTLLVGTQGLFSWDNPERKVASFWAELVVEGLCLQGTILSPRSFRALSLFLFSDWALNIELVYAFQYPSRELILVLKAVSGWRSFSGGVDQQRETNCLVSVAANPAGVSGLHFSLATEVVLPCHMQQMFHIWREEEWGSSLFNVKQTNLQCTCFKTPMLLLQPCHLYNKIGKRFSKHWERSVTEGKGQTCLWTEAW